MSFNTNSVVPKISRFPDKEKKIEEVLNWLISKDIIKPYTIADCTYGQTFGYPISEGAKKTTMFPNYLPFNRGS